MPPPTDAVVKIVPDGQTGMNDDRGTVVDFV